MSAQSEEQMRVAYEEELSRINATDMIAQAAVSLLTIGARRVAPPPPRPPGAAGAEGQAGEQASGAHGPQGGPPTNEVDLEQARDAIDAVRALLEILERRIPGELGALREALSRLQMTYARVAAAEEARAAAEKAENATGGGQRTVGGEGQRTAGAEGAQADGEQGETDAPTRGGEPGGEERSPGPGPAEASGRLWVPGR